MLSRNEIALNSELSITSNALSVAARQNDVKKVERLLKKMNPNCIDNRGWTCLHEAASTDSYESLKLILSHPLCRPLAETHEGQTALYIACGKQCSLKTIQALLESKKDIANYSSLESFTPLHLASGQGRVDVIHMLLNYGARINVQDSDGDTPLHEAVIHPEAVAALLSRGADPKITNDHKCTAFHMACMKGSYESVLLLYPVVTDINQLTIMDDSPLQLATIGCNIDIINFLLKHGVDPHLSNYNGETALDLALSYEYSDIFKTLLYAVDKDRIKKDIVLQACKPHHFNFEILETLLNFSLGPEFFEFSEPFNLVLEKIADITPVYTKQPSLNTFLSICEYIYGISKQLFQKYIRIFLMNGSLAYASSFEDCPPLVFLHYSAHSTCFKDVFSILIEHGCDVDYYSTGVSKHLPYKCPHMPDVFLASLSVDPTTVPVMLPYSLQCEPESLLMLGYESGMASRIPTQVLNHLLFLIDSLDENPSSLPFRVFTLKHLCRKEIRYILRRSGVSTTEQFLETLNKLFLPPLIKNYLRYL